MILHLLERVTVVAAAIPAVMTCVNLLVYRRPGAAAGAGVPAVSVLIPARNEERGIAACVESVLASRGCEFEVVVLDDASTDRTAEIVAEIAARDARVRLVRATALPDGWNGKQHACWELTHAARYDVFCFLDADVRVGPEAVARAAASLGRMRVELVSGFPRQQTGTFLERLVIPLIKYVLLGYLPMLGTRYTRLVGFGAGCGQFMMVRRAAYLVAGGHAVIRTTMHDGILLPRLFRRGRFRTGLVDLSRLAVCRMYRSAGEVWRGLSKNATEGMAAPGAILPFTVLLLGAGVMPFLLWPFAGRGWWVVVALAYFPRVVGVVRFGDSVVSAVLHPVGIFVLLVLQWNALVRKIAGKTVGWKERSYRVG